VNVGTPDSPTPHDVRVFLREFLSDRRLIALPPLLWQPILNGFILPRRSHRSAEKYASVWTEQGSPLMVHTLAQEDALAARLGDGVRVVAAMRYGELRLSVVLDGLAADGVGRVLVVPMFPQYSTTTVATVFDALERYLATLAHQPEYRTIRAWHDDPGYIEAAALRVEQAWAKEGRPGFEHGDKLLLSFHSIPVAIARAGDPYPDECVHTARLLRDRLGLDEESAPMTFQSKFGPAAWLTPATIDTVRALGDAGVRRLDVFCPGFAADCLETDEEIGILNRNAYHEHGGQRFVRIPSLNDFEPWMDAFADIVRRNLADWM